MSNGWEEGLCAMPSGLGPSVKVGGLSKWASAFRKWSFQQPIASFSVTEVALGHPTASGAFYTNAPFSLHFSVLPSFEKMMSQEPQEQMGAFTQLDSNLYWSTHPVQVTCMGTWPGVRQPQICQTAQGVTPWISSMGRMFSKLLEGS